MLLVCSLLYSDVTSDISELDPYIEQVSHYGTAADYIRKVTDGNDIDCVSVNLEVTVQGENKQLDDEICVEGHDKSALDDLLAKLDSGDYTIANDSRIIVNCKKTTTNRKRMYTFQQVGA